MFNDVYNKRLPPTADDDLPMLSLLNGTGREVLIDQLDGLQVNLFELILDKSFFPSKFDDDPKVNSRKLTLDQLVPLKVPEEHQTTGRLSVIEDQSFRKREEFTVKVPIFLLLSLIIPFTHSCRLMMSQKRSS